jgi:multiple sugar transport system substrate-binding protein
MKKFAMSCVAVAMLALITGPKFVGVSQAEDITLTYWSHEADQTAKVALREQVARDFEKTHPGVHVKITWYEMAGLQAALKTALPAGQGPDILYTEPGWEDYYRNGYVIALDNLINWNNIYDWARKAVTVDGHTWAVPQEAYTDEIYYNKDLLKKVGLTLPANGQFTQSQFLDLVKAARAAGITPIGQGTADRNFPGAFITIHAILKMVGPEDYGKLWAGKLSFDDPRVVKALTWVKEVVTAGAYPSDLLTMKLGESHAYFYQKPLALMLPMGSWYTGRAFVPTEKGGQPADFPLGIMQYPAMDGGACNECKTSSVGSSQSINAASKHKDLAAEFLNAMATPEVAKRWIETVYLQSAVKTDISDFGGPHGAYFAELMERQKGAKYFIGEPTDGLITGQCKDTYTQVINTGFPAGLISVDDAVKLMNQSCYKG